MNCPECEEKVSGSLIYCPYCGNQLSFEEARPTSIRRRLLGILAANLFGAVLITIFIAPSIYYPALEIVSILTTLLIVPYLAGFVGGRLAGYSFETVGISANLLEIIIQLQGESISAEFIIFSLIFVILTVVLGVFGAERGQQRYQRLLFQKRFDEGSFISNTTLAKWTIATLLISSVGFMLLEPYYYYLIYRAAVSRSKLDLTSYESLSNPLLPLSLIFVILFFLWIYRVHKNLAHLNVSGLKFTPGWVVGYFFIPIFNLFMPYQALQEIWKASDPETDLTDSLSWQKAERSKMIFWTWLIFLTSLFPSTYKMATFTTNPDISHFYVDAFLSALVFIPGILSLVFDVIIIREITKRQEKKFELVRTAVADKTHGNDLI